MVLIAIMSPIDYWAGSYFFVHMCEHVLIAFLAPALIVLGAPWLPLRRGLSELRRGLGQLRRGLSFWRHGRAPAAAADAAGPDLAGASVVESSAAGAAANRSARGWLSWPVAVTAAFTVAWCGWHIPVLYDAALRHPLVYAAEVVSYLGVGTAFWLQLIGSRPLTPQFPPLQRVMLIAATVVTSTILGMVLGFGANVIYPAYRGGGHHHLLTVVADQQVAGAILWVLVLPSYIIAGVALLVRWLDEEESEAIALGFDRLLRPPKSAWPTRSGLR
jgi:cytochrome c oxidase assembly factor CtaG